MKDLTIEEFAGSGVKHLAHILQEATNGNEIYRISTWDSGSFVIMSEDEYNILRDALKIVIKNTDALITE